MNKKWIFKFFSYGLIFATIFIGFNFLIDPYGVFGNHNKFSKIKNHIASDRMTKFYYAKRSKAKTILIGTSRVGVINTKTVEKYTHNKTYNLSLDGSSIREEYEYAKFAIDDLKIKNLIWGIDFFSFNPDSKLPSAFSQERLEKNLYIKDYRDSLLTMDVFFASIATLKDNIMGKKKLVNYETGQNNFLKHKNGIKKEGTKFLDKKIAEGLKGYRNTKELYGSKKFKDPTSINTKFIYIKKIVQLCKHKNINLYIYINPIYIKTLKLINNLKLWETYKNFKITLSSITSFWDFNENLKLISNKNNFWDNSHVREKIGDKIIYNIFKTNNKFGTFVTKKNVAKHLQKLKREIK